MSHQLSISGFQNPAIVISPAAFEKRDELCLKAMEIEKVSSPEEQKKAIELCSLLKGMKEGVETDRLDLTRPIDAFKKHMIETTTTFTESLVTQLSRVLSLVASYQDVERLKAQRIREEEEKKRMEALRKAQEEEAVLQKKIAAAKSPMEQEKLEIELEKKNESFRETIVQSHVAVLDAQPVKAKGMGVSKNYDFEVLDVHVLYKQNPAFVTMEANKVVIKSMLRQGMKECPGLKIFEAETKVSIKAAK